jgi:DNA repair exonuclease SbcCD ATPase subunit
MHSSSSAERPPKDWTRETTSFASNNYESFEELKQRIGFLMVENKDLESQYQALYQEYSKLKAQMDALTAEEQVSQRFPDPSEEDATFDVDPSIEKLSPAQVQNEILIKKSRVSHLSAQLIDAEDKEHLWQLQLANLETQKRELNIEGNVKQLSAEEIQEKKEAELAKIQQAIDENIQQEQNIYRRIKELESRKGNSFKTDEQLTQENADLELDIASLERRTALNLKENAILEKKKLLVEKSHGGVSDENRQAYRALQDEVALLEEEYAQMDETIEHSLDQQERQKELIRAVIEIDKQNQQLRERINALQQQMSGAQALRGAVRNP